MTVSNPGYAIASAITLAIVAPGAAHAAAGADPSFDCATAKMDEVSRAICSDPATAALDRRIAARFETLRRDLPEDAAMALADDQHYFEELRGLAFRASGGNAASLQAMLAERASFLDAVVLGGPQLRAGTWRNFTGAVTVTDDGSAMIVEMQPAYGQSICRVTGSLEGAALAGKVTLHGQPGRGVELGRFGTVMVVTDSAMAPASPCALGGEPFFRVAVQPEANGVTEP
ncbi:DUF1311 domain-containing protein [Novosphingobium sp. P6W]|uniref:DUF1311 domain-containing protein n=1 Tax=Novosphingobium sp. P6W TaxID=1609758 RepID=UPI000A82B193|nr:DUF1311 domain-containing protein [Novosphingobium sp. P6W]